MQVQTTIKTSIVFWGLLASAAANAQTDPGSLERTRPQVEVPPSGEVAPTITAPDMRTKSPAIERTFVLSAVVLEGVTAFNSEELAATFEPYLADRIGQAELNKIAAAITDRYRQAGYILSFAVVPKQSIQSGIVRIQVVEGYIGRIRLVGNRIAGSAVRRIFQSLPAKRPLRGESLERTIGLGRNVPGVVIKDVQISRSAEDPAQHLLIVVLNEDRFRAMSYIDNRGTITNARLRSYSSFSLSSLAVPGDQLQVEVFAIPYEKFRYAFGQLKGSMPIGADGLRIAAFASYADSLERLPGTDQDGVSRQVMGEISYPFVKSRALSLTGFVQVGDLKSELERLGTVVQRDRIQVARTWLEFTRAGPTRIDGRFGVSRGLDRGPGTEPGDPLASRPGAGSKFTKFNGSLQVTAHLSDRIRFRFDSVGQYSTNPLLAPEEFALGGSRIGRAFDFNEITGDHGFGAMLELAFRTGDAKHAPSDLELFTFVDGGGAFRKKALPGLVNQGWLAGAGAGARFRALGVHWSAELGVPLTRTNAHRDLRAFFSTTKVF